MTDYEFEIFPDIQFVEEDYCTICGTTQNIHRHDGELFCEQHLQENLAREG